MMIILSKDKFRFLTALLVLVWFATVFVSCKKQDGSVNFTVKDLITDEEFQWKDSNFGDSIEETEKKLDISFPSIPFNAVEWMMGNLQPKEEDFYDYRNNNDYDFVEFAAYQNKKPVTTSYGDYPGSYTCEFHEGKLRCIYFYFGDGPMPHDAKMDFDGKKQDTKAIYEKLLNDAKAALGEPDDSYQLFKNDCYLWNGKTTRLSIAWNTREGYSNYAMLAINKIIE